MPEPEPSEWDTTAADATGDIGPWSDAWRPDPELEVAFVALIAQLRRLQELAAGSRPTVAAANQAARLVAAAADQLSAYQVDEHDQIAGKQPHLPGRAQTLHPTGALRTRVRRSGAGPRHLLPVLPGRRRGRPRRGTAAGVRRGARPAGGRRRPPASRTAYLHVNYRSVTPLDRELQVQAAVDRIEGRKIWITASLRDGSTLLSDAESLFVTLLPGQP